MPEFVNSFEEFFEKDSLNTLKTISEARITYHGATACGDLSATYWPVLGLSLCPI
jgi:hypothetical protein